MWIYLSRVINHLLDKIELYILAFFYYTVWNQNKSLLFWILSLQSNAWKIKRKKIFVNKNYDFRKLFFNEIDKVLCEIGKRSCHYYYYCCSFATMWEYHLKRMNTYSAIDVCSCVCMQFIGYKYLICLDVWVNGILTSFFKF